MFKNKNKAEFRMGNKQYPSHKAYTNPYFKDANKNSNIHVIPALTWKIKIVLFLIFASFLFIFWVFLYSKYFLIHDIQTHIEKINNISLVTEADINKLAREELRSKFIFFPGNNIFIFDEKKLYNKISNQFAFEEVDIKKQFPNKLIINLKEVSYALIWKEEGTLYYITPKGNIITEITEDEVKDIFPLVENKGKSLIENGEISAEKTLLEFAIKLFKNFKDTNTFNIEKFIIGNKNNNTLTMKIFEGPEVYFNVTEDIETQSNKLILLKKDKLKDDLYTKTYIDLRFGDMIYYR